MKAQLRRSTLAIALLFVVASAGVSKAQEGMPEMPKPTKEHELLKKEVGDWKAEMRAWMGPGEPVVSAGREHNEMVGGFWCLSKFEGSFAGQPFLGTATLGYNAAEKVYTGSWVDSVTPERMSMTGTYDEKSKTMTWKTESVGPDGEPVVGKMTVVYKDEDTRSMTMFNPAGPGGEMMKVMEIDYSRATKVSKADTGTGISISPAGSDGK
ncbi:MAG: DUF1579 domain-containing protein [Pirellulaceae bacterium]